jgi:hypothetical protein
VARSILAILAVNHGLEARATLPRIIAGAVARFALDLFGRRGTIGTLILSASAHTVQAPLGTSTSVAAIGFTARSNGFLGTQLAFGD